MMKEEKQMRLFVAVKFSPEIEKSLTDLQAKMKENNITGNYTNCQNLHLTLAFIGEYNSPNKVMKALNQVEFEPFEISLGETIGNFGGILWVGLKRNFKLMTLAESVRKALESEHIPFDCKPFNPHITIIRKARVFSEQRKYIKLLRIENVKMKVEKFSLIHSHRENGKLIYTEIGNVKAK